MIKALSVVWIAFCGGIKPRRCLDYRGFMNDIELYNIALPLLKDIGLKGEISITHLSGGMNNRVFKAQGRGKAFLLKLYFTSSKDLRDRGSTEFSFCNFAWKNGIKSVPEPYIFDSKNHLGVYEFIEGSSFKAGSIERRHVDAAVDFFLSLNACRDTDLAKALPPASEACFSIDQHITCIDKRVSRLNQIKIASDIDNEAHSFVSNRLIPFWLELKERVIEDADSFGLDVSYLLPEQLRCVSPSDFGFHNALLQSDGSIRFFDFEYAGWDDPAKAVCDFFFQPAVPVPEALCRRFAAAVLDIFKEDDGLNKRIQLLRRLYGVKWCCIILNEFLAVDSKRRSFACGSDLALRKSTQLSKAANLLSQLQDF
ncbi:MAG: aminoglycoside phosphotransferase family protein [Candidatus Dadabacteria bacterium]|nr:MAG: aminoglycoside phosphotransferase family protein [Candidatus Dadabacteria bacterium]